MLNRLRELLSQPRGADAGQRPHSFEERQLAAAALMVEAARLDAEFDAGERARIEQLLRGRFGLSKEEARDLLGEAERTADHTVQIQGFTRTIKDHFDYDERVGLIEMLWEVAYADRDLHDYEASLIRRVTGLLYVQDRDSGEARKRVLTRLGLA